MFETPTLAQPATIRDHRRGRTSPSGTTCAPRPTSSLVYFPVTLIGIARCVGLDIASALSSPFLALILPFSRKRSLPLTLFQIIPALITLSLPFLVLSRTYPDLSSTV